MSSEIDTEIDFWVQILQDHLTFILEALDPKEIELVRRVNELQGYFVSNNDPLEDVVEAVSRLRNLKRDLLERLLVDPNFSFKLTPTFISHMLNELEQFAFILDYIIQNGTAPPTLFYNHHKLWLVDTEGHLSAIMKDLDGVEIELKKVVKDEKKRFNHLKDKLLEFIDYFKHGMREFNALTKLNDDAITETNVYLALIQEIAEMIQNKEILGRLTPLMLDHMRREQEYYLSKLDGTVVNTYRPEIEYQLDDGMVGYP